MNDLNDEIDLLIDDINSNPLPSSSAFDNLNSWQNDYFQPNSFYQDFFPNQSNNNNDNNNNSTNNFTSNPLTFI
jgi:hypothetical protein